MPTVLVYRRILLPLSETFIKDQLIALRRWRGVLVGLHRLRELPLDGIDVRTLRADHRTFFERLRWKLSKWIGTVPQPVIERLKKEGAALLHVHFGVDAIEAWPIAKALNLPMLVTLWGYDINIDRGWWEAGHGGRNMRSFPTRLLKIARQPRVRFIAISDAIRQRAISYGIPEEKIWLCHTGIDCAKFAPSGLPIVERERRVLFVARLVEKKGCEYLIRAFAKVQKKVLDASLIIVGDGDLRDELQQLARELEVNAQFRGALSSVEVVRDLQMTRVFCLPSVRAANGDAEGFGIVLLEAEASGVPVVTSAIGGATEGIDHGVTGFAFAERDVDTLAARLTTLLTDDALAISMAHAGPRFVSDRFDLYRCTERLESLYDIASAPASEGAMESKKGRDDGLSRSVPPRDWDGSSI
jgi:glycosyltransferase involved in cell wall biosynthesis